MAKLQDKFFNRIIEGNLQELSSEDVALLVAKLKAGITSDSVKRRIVDDSIDHLTDEFLKTVQSGDIVVESQGGSAYTAYLVDQETIVFASINQSPGIYLCIYEDRGEGYELINDFFYNIVDGATMSKIWEVEIINDVAETQDLDATGMKIGDIIVDVNYDFVGIVRAVTVGATGSLTYVDLYGIELDGSPVPLEAHFTAGAWHIVRMSGGTKLYKHDMHLVGGDDGGDTVTMDISIINNRSNSFSESYSLMNLHDNILNNPNNLSIINTTNSEYSVIYFIRLESGSDDELYLYYRDVTGDTSTYFEQQFGGNITVTDTVTMI